MKKEEKERINEINASKNKKERKRQKKISERANHQMMFVTYIFLMIFAGMIGYFVKFMVVDSEELINNNYNNRQEVLEENVLRGKILSDDKQVLAETITDYNGNETRNYPFGTLFSHSVGYSTHGKTGVELLGNFKLLTSNSPVDEIVSNDLTGKKDIGDNVITSLNVELTKVAYNELGDYNGAIIAIEPSTGKIVTMVSKPDFDPNTIDDIYDTLIADSTNSNLLNRVTGGLYTPGSTFKIFTLLEYIHEHPEYSNYYYNCKGSISYEGTTINCANGRRHGEEDLTDSFANSCNSSFVNMGLELDKTKFKELCNSLLFNSELPLNLPYSKSEFVLDESSSVFEIMQTSMGQGKTLVTPMHLCLIASAIANDGILMKPYMITRVENHFGKEVKSYGPQQYGRILSASDVDALRPFLRAVVTQGTGSKLNTEQYTAYGKTGTAQINDGSQTNSLFVGYAEANGKKLAVCIVMEDQPEGSTPAVPVARAMFETYFRN